MFTLILDRLTGKIFGVLKLFVTYSGLNCLNASDTRYVSVVRIPFYQEVAGNE